MASRHGETPRILNLSGSLMVDRAAALKAEILAALETSSNILLSISLVEDLDLSCLQVFYAAKRDAIAAGKDLHFVGSIPTRIAKRLEASGILHGTPERAEDFEAGLVDFQ